MPRLTQRQRVFVHYCMQIHTYRTHTDAYIAVYKPKGTRRTATANASRIYNKPAVRAYIKKLDKLEMKRAVDLKKLDRQNFLDKLAATR